jgi:hypothetical protein
MPFGKYETPKPVTPPTFRQYLKSCGKGVEGKTKFQVDIVWMPGQFSNVTLQTHAFRYIVDDSHPLYDEMQSYIKNCLTTGNCPRLNIVIDSIQEATIDLTEDPKVKGNWEKLGSNAYKYKNP